MKLQGDIYSILQSTNDTAGYEFRIQLNSDSPIYKGHFPGNPITPGVVIIAIARELIEHITGQKLQLTVVQSVKYTSILSPIISPTVKYIISTTSDGDIVNAKISVTGDSDTFARMSLKWTKI